MSYTAVILCMVFAVYGILLGIACGVCISKSSCDIRKLYDVRMSKLSEKAASEKSLMTHRPEELRLYTQAYDNLCQYKDPMPGSPKYNTYLFTYKGRADSRLSACYWFVGDKGMGGAKRMLQHVLANLLINAMITTFLILFGVNAYGVKNSVIIGAVILVSFTLSGAISALVDQRFGNPPISHTSIEHEFYIFDLVKVQEPPAAAPVKPHHFYRDCTEQQREEINQKIKAHKLSEQWFTESVKSCVETMTGLSSSLAEYSQYCSTMHNMAITVSAIYAVSVPVIMLMTGLIMILH